MGRDNYRWFLGLLASLSVLLPYGAALAFSILRQSAPQSAYGITETGWKAMFRSLGDLITSDARVGCIGLLAGLTGPLAWGLFGYHIYLIWAGTTTNETMKWDDLREDMAAGLVYKGIRVVASGPSMIESAPMADEELSTRWPNSSNQIIVRTEDGERLLNTRSTSKMSKDFKRCWHLGDIVNVYDVGFWDNLRDAVKMLPS